MNSVSQASWFAMFGGEKTSATKSLEDQIRAEILQDMVHFQDPTLARDFKKNIYIDDLAHNHQPGLMMDWVKTNTDREAAISKFKKFLGQNLGEHHAAGNYHLATSIRGQFNALTASEQEKVARKLYDELPGLSKQAQGLRQERAASDREYVDEESTGRFVGHPGEQALTPEQARELAQHFRAEEMRRRQAAVDAVSQDGEEHPELHA